jgi:hypothetical protein
MSKKSRYTRQRGRDWLSHSTGTILAPYRLLHRPGGLNNPTGTLPEIRLGRLSKVSLCHMFAMSLMSTVTHC